MIEPGAVVNHIIAHAIMRHMIASEKMNVQRKQIVPVSKEIVVPAIHRHGDVIVMIIQQDAQDRQIIVQIKYLHQSADVTSDTK